MSKLNHFLSVKSTENPLELADLALSMKNNSGNFKDSRKGLSLCLIFFNSSLRTRLSTQKAAFNLGMDVAVFNVGEDGWQLEFDEGVVMNGNKAEHIKEAAPVIGSYFDIIGIRAFASLENKISDYQEQVLNAFVKYSGKPILNLESATTHPLQSLTDVVTILEHKKVARPKIVLSWAPHPRTLPQAVPNSFSEWVLACKFDLTIVQPKGYELSEEFTKGATISYSQEEAFEGADFIYAKNWSSYTDYGKILSSDPKWMIDREKMDRTANAFFMHCLPVRRNVIVSDEVIDSAKSIVLKQAENRQYAAQAALFKLSEME